MKRTPRKRKIPLRSKPQVPLCLSDGTFDPSGLVTTKLKIHKIRISGADRIFSLYIRARDGWNCQRCGRRFGKPSMGLHNSHFIGRDNKATRWDPNNCVAACYGCHQIWETHKGTAYRAYMEARLGARQFDALVAASNTLTKDTQERRHQIVQTYTARLREMGYDSNGHRIPGTPRYEGPDMMIALDMGVERGIAIDTSPREESLF